MQTIIEGPPRIAIISGTGKTGRAIAAALTARGLEPVPIGRRELADPEAALRGCAAAYLMAPNLHPDEAGFIADMIAAVRAAGIDRVVYHSVASPYAPAMPHHLAKAKSEDLVRRSGLSYTILQPCAYVDNLLPGLSSDSPVITVPYSPDTPFAMVGLADLAEVAAEVLCTEDHIGATYEIGGPALVTVREIASIASSVLGAEVDLEVSAPSDWVSAQRGGESPLDEREVEWLAAMFDYYDHHGLPCATTGVPTILGRPARSVEQTLRAGLTGL